MKPALGVTVAAAALMTAAGCTHSASGGQGGRSETTQVRVPDVTGKPFEAAVQELRASGFQLSDVKARRASPAPLTVIQQSLAPGTLAPLYMGLTLTVSAGSHPTNAFVTISTCDYGVAIGRSATPCVGGPSRIAINR